MRKDIFKILRLRFEIQRINDSLLREKTEQFQKKLIIFMISITELQSTNGTYPQGG